MEDILLSPIEHSGGIKMKISCSFVDSGGHHAEEVYRFCKRLQKQGHRIYPIKGASTYGKPIISKPTRNNRARVMMFSIGTDTAKDTIFARLKLEHGEEGFCHFPITYEEDYFKQLTSEKLVYRYERGRTVRKYIKKTESARNEALDCRVYAYSALRLLNPNFKKIKIRIDQTIEKLRTPSEEKTHDNIKSKKTARKKGFVNSWKE